MSATGQRQEYLVRLGQQVFGPLSESDVCKRFQRSEITPVHELSSDGGRTWLSARQAQSMLASSTAIDDPMVDPSGHGGAWMDSIGGMPSAGAAPTLGWSLAGMVTPAVVLGVAGALTALTMAMPMGREGSSLRWLEEPTPIVISLCGATLLACGIGERRRDAHPSKGRAMACLVAAGVAAAASASSVVIAQGAWGWTAVANVTILLAVALAWSGRLAAWPMVVAGLGGVDALVAGAVTSRMSLLVTALLPMAGAACAVALQTGAWPKRATTLSIAAAALAGVGVFVAGMLAYSNSNPSDRFLVLDAARHLLVSLCAAIASVVALHELDQVNRPLPTGPIHGCTNPTTHATA